MPLAQVNGTEIWYDVKGTGEPIILLPGLGLDHGYYRIGEPLLRQEMKTIVVDPRGIGQSRKVQILSIRVDRVLIGVEVVSSLSGNITVVHAHP